jgi:hypothetical protein
MTLIVIAAIAATSCKNSIRSVEYNIIYNMYDLISYYLNSSLGTNRLRDKENGGATFSGVHNFPLFTI